MAENKEWREPATSNDNIKICAECCYMQDKNKKIEDIKNGVSPFKVVEGNIQEIKAYPGGKKEMEKKSQETGRD